MEQGYDERRGKTRFGIFINTLPFVMEEKKVYFISDLHLGARTLKSPRENEKRVVQWLDEIKDKASAVYLLGDILDYWFEYRCVVPRGFTRFFGKIAELTDRGVEVHWFIGNHDIWIFDYLPTELGIILHKKSLITEICGKRFYLGHGDGEGKRSLGFLFIRALFRNRVCQKLYSAIHPWWTVPFAYGWSSNSRKSAGCEPKFANNNENPLVEFATQYNQTAEPKIDYFVFGHQHILFKRDLSSSGEIVLIGDWISHFSYACFDGTEVELGYLKTNQ